MPRLVLFELFVTNLLLFEHQQKFSGTYGVTKYGSGRRKDVLTNNSDYIRHLFYN